jgi:hypothetical protein
MQQLVRRLFLASLLALYGSVTVCGPALHSLPGCDHPGQLQTADQGSQPRSLTSSPDDCPICHFQSQGQFLVASDRDVCTDIVRIRPTDEPPLAVCTSVVRISIPRAPPLS